MGHPMHCASFGENMTNSFSLQLWAGDLNNPPQIALSEGCINLPLSLYSLFNSRNSKSLVCVFSAFLFLWFFLFSKRIYHLMYA